MSSRRQKLLARVHCYLQSSLKHITGIEYYYRGVRYRQVSPSCKASVMTSWCLDNGRGQTINSNGSALDIPEYCSLKINRPNQKMLCKQCHSTGSTRMPIKPHEAIVHDCCPFVLVGEGTELPNNICSWRKSKSIYVIYITKPRSMYGGWLNKVICCFVS